jgi:hypothetical protein
MIVFFVHCWRYWKKLTPEERRKIREEQRSDENSAW